MIVDSRFNGPTDSGNGGYTCGLIATAVPPPAGHTWQVTLRTPPPLDTPMRAVHRGADRAVYAGERLVAEAVPVGIDTLGEPPPAAPYAQAAEVSPQYAGFTDHPFPRCYVCGPRRADDGLRIFPGPLPSGGTAAPWEVPADVSAVTVWAALDCPGGWAIIAGAGRPYVLGRMAAVVETVPPPGGECVAVGEVVEAEGRKALVRSAVYPRQPSGGRPLAWARATWIAL